jgi:protein-disulfide isomerase
VAETDSSKLTAYHQILYTQQKPEGEGGLSNAELIAAAQHVGVTTPGAFATCVNSDKYKNWVRQVEDTAEKKGVVQTPTVFLNGKALTQATDPTKFAAALAAAVSA